jgi:4-diphosphocytidyl-2-C-methyl-D-erythritol kinase
MIIFPNCKINIGLQVIEKRKDGYHNISSIFCPLALEESLEIIESEQLQFTSSGIAIPNNGNQNLCMQAYHLIQKEYTVPPVHIHLHKALPIGAGLGGGSADAACTLLLLNTMFNLEISNETLLAMASSIGSDCAFFINNKMSLASNKGEVLKPIDLDLSNYKIVLLFSAIHISTPWAYNQISASTASFNLDGISNLAIDQWKNIIENDFEKPVFAANPILKELKESLYQHGAMYASMSGSGSSIYGIFNNDTTIPQSIMGYNTIITRQKI